MAGWEVWTYTPTADGYRWGVGLCDGGTWRSARGVSVVVAGRGYALIWLPKSERW